MPGINNLRAKVRDAYIGPSMNQPLRSLLIMVVVALAWFGCEPPNAGGDGAVAVLTEPVTSFDDQTDRFYMAVLVTLPDDAVPDSVWSEMYLVAGPLADYLGTDTVMARATLLDDATGGDIVPGDGVYGAAFASPLPPGSSGDVRFEFMAQGADLFTLTDTLSLINLRPVILEVSALSTLTLPDTGITQWSLDTLRVTVTDPDGLEDIKGVNFSLLKPDSTLGNAGVPVDLVDDGELGLGDKVAGDGIYSRVIGLQADADSGIWVYRFVATDFNGSRSDTAFHSVLVTP
jgi:hypothetical protein